MDEQSNPNIVLEFLASHEKHTYENHLTAEHLVGDWIVHSGPVPDQDGDKIIISPAGDTFDVVFSFYTLHTAPQWSMAEDFGEYGKDGEVYEASEVEWADGVLSFLIPVPSTGYELSLTSSNQAVTGQLSFRWRSKKPDGKVKGGLVTLTRAERVAAFWARR